MEFRKRPDITEEAFFRFLKSLHGDSSQSELEYEKLLSRLQRFFAGRGAGVRDSELADEVISRVIRRFEGNGSLEGNTVSFALGVARLVWKEQARRPAFAPLPPELPSSSIPNPESEDEGKRTRACLVRCLARLSPEDSTLITSYYQAERNVRIQMMRDHTTASSKTPEAFRTRLSRIRKRLAACVIPCVSSGRNVTLWAYAPDKNEPPI